MKKSFVLYLFLFAVLACFSGCGQSTFTKRPISSTTDFSSSEIAPSAEAVDGLIADEIIPLPDIELGLKGKGFTCTGLTYDEAENVFWMGNCGKKLPDSEGYSATIVKVSADGKTNLGEIKLYDLYPSMSDIQGLTLDLSDNTLWFCAFSENKVRQLSKSGDDLGGFDLSEANGICYDSRTDTLWILTRNVLINTDKTGNILKTIDVSIEGQDQLFLDEVNNIMYLTAGNNYKSENYVYSVDLSTNAINKTYTLSDSYAVEGLYMNKSEMYVLNDGYYHSGKVRVNQINKYKLA